MKPAYLFLAVLVMIMYSITTWAAGQEGFENAETETVSDPYDEFYAEIYDTLWNSSEECSQFTRVSIQDISLAEQPVASVHILDMACGTSPHACWFKNMGVEFTGIDSSSAMISKAHNNCPSATFKEGDVKKAATFAPKTFSHVMLMGFSIYEIPSTKILADNAYLWTKPGGYFIVHMVNPDKYDPLLNLASPFAAFSLQKYALERQVDSEIYFDSFKYRGTLNKKVNDEDAKFQETFTFFNPKKYREQVHEWSMPSMEDLIDTIRSAGWRHKESVHMVSCGKEYQYAVYFSK